MLIDPKLIGYLHRAVNHEMAAVQQYLTQATLCGLWGMSDAASKLRQESAEELEHAERLIRYMLGLGLLPNGTQLPAVKSTQNLQQMLLADWQLEADVIHLYREATQHCQRVGNDSGFRLFNDLLKEEQDHLKSIESWLLELEQRDV